MARIGWFVFLCLMAAPGMAQELSGLIQKAQAELDQIKDFNALAAAEAGWAQKIEARMKAEPKGKDRDKAFILLARLYGGAPDCGAKVLKLYEQAKAEGASKAWFTGFLRMAYYQISGRDPANLKKLLGDAEKVCTQPEAKAAAVFYHGELLLKAKDWGNAQKQFTRVTTEFPKSSYKSWAQGNLQEISKLGPNLPAPDVKLPKVGGGQVHLGALKGKVVVLFFWSHWAPLLQDRVKRLNALLAQHKANPFAILGVCLDEARDEAVAIKTISDLKMNWAHGFDKKGWANPLVQQYNIKTMPRTFLIDPNGKLLAKDVLYKTVNLEHLVSDAVAKRKAEIQKAKAAAEAKAKAEAAAKAKAKAKPAPKK